MFKYDLAYFRTILMNPFLLPFYRNAFRVPIHYVQIAFVIILNNQRHSWMPHAFRNVSKTVLSAIQRSKLRRRFRRLSNSLVFVYIIFNYVCV